MEPLTALNIEQKASKILDILKHREEMGEDTIKYFSGVLLDWYNKGYDDSIIAMGKFK